MLGGSDWGREFCGRRIYSLFGCEHSRQIWLNRLKRHKKYGRPYIGVLATNLYAARVFELEHIVLNFPEVKRGFFVEAVIVQIYDVFSHDMFESSYGRFPKAMFMLS